MRNDENVSALINEYFKKTNTKEGIFLFDGKYLSSFDFSSLFES